MRERRYPALPDQNIEFYVTGRTSILNSRDKYSNIDCSAFFTEQEDSLLRKIKYCFLGISLFRMREIYRLMKSNNFEKNF